MKRLQYKLGIIILFSICYFAPAITDAKSMDLFSSSSKTKAKKFVDNKYVRFKDSTKVQTEITKFYRNRENHLAWVQNGQLNQNGRDLLRLIKNADKEGLSPEFYNYTEITAKLKQMQTKQHTLYDNAELDYMLTNAYMKYASDISTGRVNPGDLNVIWEIHKEEHEYSTYLEKALQHNSLEKSLKDLRPKHKQYELLIDAYKQLSELRNEGGWSLPGEDVPRLEQNDSVPEVISIKKRLATSGYLLSSNDVYLNDELFDEQLTNALKSFQRAHGLDDDGIVGKNTLRELNKPVEYRLAQIKLNIDRLRWLPESVGERDIIVNIPDFKLQYFDNNQLRDEMAVVVGETSNYTPALKDTITYIVINPTWNVPWSIATKEMLPKTKADPTYLSLNNFKLVRGSYASTDVVDPQRVDWSKISARNFPFSIIQKPGYGNALGRVKFMLPNNQNIYLHDTPADHLFSRTERDFSHGCVRLEKPFQLAETILEGQVTPQEFRRKLNSGKTESVVLNKPVPVHLIYRTAWIDDYGTMQFRKDIYGFDERSMPVLDIISQPLATKEAGDL
ncbi:MAG TPA: L,D-transpeptidase family protein [Prolixibacteraceae bacterium]|nr:L,D-transpeptidase family protein [Prolixibacteraceae bacterium]